MITNNYWQKHVLPKCSEKALLIPLIGTRPARNGRDDYLKPSFGSTTKYHWGLKLCVLLTVFFGCIAFHIHRWDGWTIRNFNFLRYQSKPLISEMWFSFQLLRLRHRCAQMIAFVGFGDLENSTLDQNWSNSSHFPSNPLT